MTNDISKDSTIRRDRLRYTKNSLASGLAILAILFNVIYFVSIYKSDVGDFYYKYIIGISVLYNLFFMLAAFLSSEGVKNYKAVYGYVLMALGAGQIARIFILPLKAHGTVVSLGGMETVVMGNAQFTRVIVYLTVSAVCCIAAGIVGIVRSSMLKKHLAAISAEK